MEKFFKSFVILFMISILSNLNGFAKNNVSKDYLFSSLEENFNTKNVLNKTIIIDEVLFATPPPTVTSPVYLCQSKTTTPLTATASPGGTLNWYLTNVITETPLATAPTPSTVSVGSKTYYVSQTIGIDESVRVPIVINVVADNGATILGLVCDPSQILLADKNSSVFFDWANNTAISNSYNYTYTIQGGLPVSGNTGFSHVQVFGMLPGQSATLILNSASHPCVPSQTITCSVPCGPITTTTFAPIQTSYCQNATPLNLPTTSNNIPPIKGSWSPSAINTGAFGTANYVFTPDPIQFPCASKKTLTVTVALVSPTFSTIPSAICQNSSPIILPTSSSDTPAVTGTWNVPTISTNAPGISSYTFTPNAILFPCAAPKMISVAVNPINTATSINADVVSNFFDSNQQIKITVTGAGTYVYQLDEGPFQDSPIFENVSLGLHSVSVKDINGCSVSIGVDNILVINYPKYFTPNGDSYNDTWNIVGLKDQLNTRIYIFDRFGKLLKDISPNGSGWNGTYNGQPMPANDYWFTVEYSEQNVVKKLRSHFSLKR